MTTILHASGFVRDGKVSSVNITMYEGSLVEVANEVLAVIRSQGHEVRVVTTRSLGPGWLRAVDATVIVDPENPMWHRFSEPDDPWARST